MNPDFVTEITPFLATTDANVTRLENSLKSK